MIHFMLCNKDMKINFRMDNHHYYLMALPLIIVYFSVKAVGLSTQMKLNKIKRS